MGLQFYGTGGDSGVIGLLVPFLNQPLYRDAHLPGQTMEQRSIPHDDLQYPVHIPKIHKGYPSMISDILNPAGHAKFPADVALTDFL